MPRRADNEARGGYSPERHQAFTDAGFYRMLQPRRYGGYEVGLDDFLRVVIEVSRADPATGWAMCLASAHVFQFAAFFGATAQDEMFPADGHVVIPSRNIPRGTVTPVDGGWMLDGTWDYASGCTYATHMMGVALDPDRPEADLHRPRRADPDPRRLGRRADARASAAAARTRW